MAQALAQRLKPLQDLVGGFDLAGGRVEVVPTAHYMMGGVWTDVHGATTLPGLYAAGEVACSGVHGANRLASNSLLDGLVFGMRAAQSAVAHAGHYSEAGPLPSIEELERRLRNRGSDSEDVIARRVAGALGEMRHVAEFDFVIINKDLDVALDELRAAVRASRLRFPRQRARHPDVFRFLDQD